MNTIYFWGDPAKAAGELLRVLEPGGRLVLAFSPREAMERLPVDRSVFSFYDPDQVRSLMLESGFEEVRMQPGDGPASDFVCAVASKAAAV